MTRMHNEGHEGHEEGFNAEARRRGGAEDMERETGSNLEIRKAGRGEGLALPFGGSEAEAAEAVRRGWRRAQAGLVEVLRFGAMLIEVKKWIENGAIENGATDGADGADGATRSLAEERVQNPGHGWNKGTGLKAWLEAHCPEVNYKTAYGYLVAAEGLRVAARIAADVPLLAMMGEDPVPEARAEQARQRVFKAIAGGSLALMREAGRVADPGRRGGAREGATGRRALTPLEHAELAKTEIRELLGKLGAYMEGVKPGMLTVDERQWAATRMKDLAARLLEKA